MPRTATAPPTDARLWRLLLVRVHPDTCGSGELFVWVQGLREVLADGPPARRESCGRCNPAQGSPAEEPERIPFDADLDPIALSRRVLTLADELEHPYSAVLRLLSNCGPATHGRPQLQERRGATYRQLAAIAHTVGMSYPERLEWYKVAESVPISQRAAAHVLSRLKEQAA